MNPILLVLLIFAGLGLFFGLLLALAAKLFEVRKDEKTEKIRALLPGANCGGCGYSGCDDLAAALSRGEAPVTACTACSKEAVNEIASILGVAPPANAKRMRAQVMCSGSMDFSKEKYEYRGAQDCVAAARLGGGSKLCLNGCIGFGTCTHVCKFDAITVKNRLAVVDYKRCTGCGTCVKACPKGIIKLIPFDAVCWVGCMSVNDGKTTGQYCSTGCISCRLCEKNCPSGAITVNNHVASIDYDKCLGCGLCAQKCPRHIIYFAVGGNPAYVLSPKTRKKEN